MRRVREVHVRPGEWAAELLVRGGKVATSTCARGPWLDEGESHEFDVLVVGKEREARGQLSARSASRGGFVIRACAPCACLADGEDLPLLG